jgi:HrpA-like RNA helicase
MAARDGHGRLIRNSNGKVLSRKDGGGCLLSAHGGAAQTEQPFALGKAERTLFEKVVAGGQRAWGTIPLPERQLEPEPELEPESVAETLEKSPAAGSEGEDDDCPSDWDISSDEGPEEAVSPPTATQSSRPCQGGAVTEVTRSEDATTAAAAAAAAAAASFFELQVRRPGYQRMLLQRQQLPAFAVADELSVALATHQAVVIAGSTGCGKSTQIPQLILDEALRKGRHCSILVTQPRRIAAVALAQRVTAERDEGQHPGAACGVVGYAIGGEVCRHARTRILYCTVGVALRRLEGQPGGLEGLQGVTHVVMDEIHERGAESDLLLLTLATLLREHRTSIKLVLMSATAHTARIVEYLRLPSGGVGTLQIEGRSYEVARRYLEDAVEETGYTLPHSPGSTNPVGRHFARRVPLEAEQGEELLRPGCSETGTINTVRTAAMAVGEAATAWMRECGQSGMLKILNAGGGAVRQYSQQTIETLRQMDLAACNLDLVVQLTAQIVRRPSGGRRGNSGACGRDDHRWESQDVRKEDTAQTDIDDGAILVFLPGLREIDALAAAMSEHPLLGDARMCTVLRLHSSLSARDQQRVFARASSRKVVLSTNIAETSITIDDTSTVIDCGLYKEMHCTTGDDGAGTNYLCETRVSCASATQRAGRAGRTRPGICWHLFLRIELDSMARETTPEICRCPLEPLILRMLAQKQPVASSAATEAASTPTSHGHGVETTFAQLLDPPPVERVRAAQLNLSALGVTAPTGGSSQQQLGLSSLGRILARLPVDLRHGHVLLWGAALRCLRPCCLVVSALSASIGHDGWLPSHDGGESRCRLDPSSDCLALLRAFGEYRAWRTESAPVAPEEHERFCRSLGLDWTSTGPIEEAAESLHQCVAGVLSCSVPATGADPQWLDEHSASQGMVRLALAKGLQPNMAQAVAPGPVGALDFVTDSTKTGERKLARVHPSSALYRSRVGGRAPTEPVRVDVQPAFVVFSTKVKTNRQVWLHQLTVVQPALAVLAASTLVPASDADAAIVDSTAAGQSDTASRFALGGHGGALRDVTLLANGIWQLRMPSSQAVTVLQARQYLNLLFDSARTNQAKEDSQPRRPCTAQDAHTVCVSVAALASHWQ